jgi:crotonobetainyl-CoA:carnitine CoA-transferase CaiB-like acyl-CoA transferase
MAHQYECADGRYIQSQGMYPVFVGSLMAAAGRPEWIEDLEDLFGVEVSPETIAFWKDRFEKMFLERTAKQWEDDIAAARGVGTICKTIDEWLVHEHAIESKMVTEVDDAQYGRMKQPGVQVRLRGTPGAIQGRAPTLGEHTEEILAEVNDGPGRPVTYPEGTDGVENIMSALEGIRVLDLCIVLAGPTCGRTLGEFGADVIKIDDPSRPYDIAGNTDVNRGKRSININLKNPEGLAVFYKLLETADVVVENSRATTLARLGISYEQMKKHKPDIIHASLNAFGYDGPWAERAGWEQLAQATSGIQVRRGGRDGTPKLLPYPMNDYGTGLMGAYAVALAVHERNRTGQGQSVNSGLALTAGLLQSPYFLDYEGHQRDEPEGLGVRGFSAKSRLYKAADGWMYFHCPSDEAWKRLESLPDFAGLDNSGDDALTKSLAEVMASKPRAEWEKLINPTGVSVIANRMVADFRDDADIRKAGLIVKRDHPGFGQADHLGNVAKLSETPMRVGRPTPLLGAETDEILIEAGYTGEEIESMKLSGAVVQQQA